MEFAIKELERSLDYIRRQMEENTQKIKRNLESNKVLKESNDNYVEAMIEIKEALNQLKRD